MGMSNTEYGQEKTPTGKKTAVSVTDHLQYALNATEDDNVAYHLSTALEMLVGRDD